MAFFLFVGGGFVVEDCVPVEADACVFCGGGESEEFVFGAPFCCYAAFLVEFAEVVEIVDVVAVALCRESVLGDLFCVGSREVVRIYIGRTGFAAGRKPDVGDADVLVGGHCILQAIVVLAVSRDVPFEALEQGIIFRCRFFGAHVGRLAVRIW